MTTATKTPANWQDGLAMADKIAGRVKLGLKHIQVEMGSLTPLELGLVEDLWDIGEIVGMTEAELDRALTGK